MRWRTLGWAGLEVEAGGESVIVDHVLDPGILSNFFSEVRDELVAPAPGGVRTALLTHLHRDHADANALARALSKDGVVYRPPPARPATELDELATGEAESALADSGLAVETCAAGESFERGPFLITALPASDGFGSPQVSWLIEAEGVKLFHGGDTLWHGGWWNFVSSYGAIDIACLPANGVVIDYPQWQPATAIPAAMTATEAIEAARVLQAGALVPIHFNRTFEHPDYYRPDPDAGAHLLSAGQEGGVKLIFAEPGDWQES